MITRQFSRYAAIGLGLNATLYVAYLLLTGYGMPPRWAMTLTYCAGTCAGFSLNKRITFAPSDKALRRFMRYLTVYALGYLINLGAIFLLEEHAKLPHQFVQAMVIVFLAVLLFILQKLWVFAPEPAKTSLLETEAV